MAQTSRNVEHRGVVKDVMGRDVFVELVRTSACGTCEAKQHCGLTETQHQILVFPDRKEDFTVGEHVLVVLEQSKGFQALFFAYVLPLCVTCTFTPCFFAPDIPGIPGRRRRVADADSLLFDFAYLQPQAAEIFPNETL